MKFLPEGQNLMIQLLAKRAFWFNIALEVQMIHQWINQDVHMELMLIISAIQ